MSEKEEVQAGAACTNEDLREERRFRHKIGVMIAFTACVASLAFVFILGWTVIVQEKELGSGAAGGLFEGITEVLKIIFA